MGLVADLAHFYLFPLWKATAAHRAPVPHLCSCHGPGWVPPELVCLRASGPNTRNAHLLARFVLSMCRGPGKENISLSVVNSHQSLASVLSTSI